MDGKRILAVIAGLVVSMLALYTVVIIAGKIYPVDMLEIKAAMQNRDLFEAYLARQPIGSLLFDAIAHAVGMFVGLCLAFFIDPRGRGSIIILDAYYNDKHNTRWTKESSAVVSYGGYRNFDICGFNVYHE